MTNLEAIQAKVGMNYPIDASFFEVAIIESGIDGNATFEGGKSFDRVMVNVIVSLLGSAESIKEGGYAVSLNLGALKDMLLFYLGKHGWKNPLNATLRDRSYMW